VTYTRTLNTKPNREAVSNFYAPLSQKQRMRVSENSILRKIFGPKWDKVMALMNEKLHDVYSSQNIHVIGSRTMRWAGQAACMQERKIP
jgi:hypothetical protein